MSTQEVPSLFDAPPPATYVQAKDFVRWCCSQGSDFRNSPDITNLRYWAQKHQVTIQDKEASVILETARQLYLKRIEQMTRKAEKAGVSDPLAAFGGLSPLQGGD